MVAFWPFLEVVQCGLFLEFRARAIFPASNLSLWYCTIPVKNCTWHRGKQQFWNVSINQPFHAPVLEVGVWTPTQSPEDEVCNISEASVTNNVPVGAIPHQHMCVKCSTVVILCRNVWEKTRISQHKTQLDSFAFIPPQPIISLLRQIVFCVVGFCFFKESMIDLHTQNFPPKWILVLANHPKLAKSMMLLYGSCKTTGTNTMTSSNKIN